MSEQMITYAKPRRAARIEAEEKELEDLLKAQAEQNKPKEEEPVVKEPEEEIEVEEKPKDKPKAKKPPKDDEEELSGEEKTYKKRYGDLRTHSQNERRELLARIEKLESKNEDVIVPTSEEDFDKFIKQYPQVASFVTTVADKKAKELFSQAETRLSRLDEIQAEVDRKAAEATILEAHSDFNKLKDSDEFHDWAEEQPKWVRDALYENDDDARSVIRVVDLYKIDNGLTPSAKKAKEKSAASSVKSKSSEPDIDKAGKKYVESVVDKMSSDQYEKEQDDILRAIREGNFVFDVTGGAR